MSHWASWSKETWTESFYCIIWIIKDEGLVQPHAGKHSFSLLSSTLLANCHLTWKWICFHQHMEDQHIPQVWAHGVPEPACLHAYVSKAASWMSKHLSRNSGGEEVKLLPDTGTSCEETASCVTEAYITTGNSTGPLKQWHHCFFQTFCQFWWHKYSWWWSENIHKHENLQLKKIHYNWAEALNWFLLFFWHYHFVHWPSAWLWEINNYYNLWYNQAFPKCSSVHSLLYNASL